MQIQGPASVHGAQRVNAPHHQPPAPSQRPESATTGGDKLDISAAAQAAADIAESGDVRLDRVAQIRQQIAQGVYETPEKLDLALERMLDEVG
ncbi:MAG: flagellar biosynthesis anti-sigma factor FlgM [Pirellulales bacterium]